MSEQSPEQVLNNLTRKLALVIALCAFPLFFLFAYLGDPARGRAAAICASVVMLCARIFWSLRRHVLFWLALMIALPGQIPLVVLNPWTNRSYPGVVLLPLALLDFAVVCGIFKLVEKATRGGKSAEDTNPET
jgi:hypothetical protein